jgi:hypothetical protein
MEDKNKLRIPKFRAEEKYCPERSSRRCEIYRSIEVR